MKKLKCWKKRLDLPYRVEYEYDRGRKAIGVKSIIVLQDYVEGGFGIRPQTLDTFSVIERKYIHSTGNKYRTLKNGKNLNKESAIEVMKEYLEGHDTC